MFRGQRVCERDQVARYARLLTALVLAAILASLFVGQAGAAEPNALSPRAQTVALDLSPSGPAAKTAQAREPVASTARRKKKKKRRRRPAPTAPAPAPAAPNPNATLSGHSDWSGAQVNLQHVAGGSWVNTSGGQSLSNASGNYGNTVVAGFTYRYYVWTRVYYTYNFGYGPVLCNQVWADTSPSVTTVGGRSYTGLDTTLQPTGPIGC